MFPYQCDYLYPPPPPHTHYIGNISNMFLHLSIHLHYCDLNTLAKQFAHSNHYSHTELSINVST